MRLLGNILWIIFGGIFVSLSWFFTGLLWCITIIGIPVGKQCFKMAGLTLAPFGKEVKSGGGAPSTLMNIFWLLFGGLELAAANALCGVIMCITIIGIPFGKQYFKLAKLSLVPFGTEIINA